MGPTIRPERAGVDESSPQSGIAQHATVQPSLTVDAKLVPPIFQKAPAISNITRVVVDVIQVQRGQRSVVDGQQQQFLFQLPTNPCDQPMDHGTQIRHGKSDAPRLDLVSVPTEHPVFGPVHADAHPVRAEMEEVIHGAGFAVVRGQRHESLDHLLHHLEMGAGFLSCVVVAVPVIPVPLNGAGAFSMAVMDHQHATHRDDARQNLGISMGGSPNPTITIPSQHGRSTDHGVLVLMVFQLVVQQCDPPRQTSVVHLLTSVVAGEALVSLDGLFQVSQTPLLSGRQTIRRRRFGVVVRSPDVTQYPSEVPTVYLDSLAALIFIERFLVVNLASFASINKLQRGQTDHFRVTHLLHLIDHVYHDFACSPQCRLHLLVWHVRPYFVITVGT